MVVMVPVARYQCGTSSMALCACLLWLPSHRRWIKDKKILARLGVLYESHRLPAPGLGEESVNVTSKVSG